jgi:hypothetical protein
MTTGSTTIAATETTAESICEVMEYIDTLIGVNAVSSQPDDIPNKFDFIRRGVDFTNEKPVIEIDIPGQGAIVHDLKIGSTNLVEIIVHFTTNTGYVTSPIQGSPKALPTSRFPSGKVSKIVIEFTKTEDNASPKDVTLSVIACAPAPTTVVTEGNFRKKHF